MIDVRVVSQQIPGGRCTLYADYAQVLTQHLGSRFHLDISAVRDAHGQGFPAIWINGSPLQPSDGVIVMPEDIVAVLGVDVDDVLHAALDAQLKKLLNEGE
jgi:cystathionine gamma-synthase